MRNPIGRTLYHWYVAIRYKSISYRGGWILTTFYLRDYKAHKASYFKIAKTHLKGWSYNDWMVLGITDQTRHKYLSTLQYCRMHPLNGRFSSWIDDKLTLKYILNGTPAGQYMPDYYFQIMDDGSITALMDIEKRKSGYDAEDIVQLLEEKHFLAFKLIQGSLGAGFYKAEWHNGEYILNGEPISRDKLLETITALRGYIVCECLLPHPEIARFNDRTVGCLRYLIGKGKDGKWNRIYSFMRVGTKKSKSVENYNAGGVLMIVDKDGRFSYGNIINSEDLTNQVIQTHPDNNIPLQGTIPLWNEVETAAQTICNQMPQLNYLGIDFCLTSENKVKIIEINSLSSLDCMQLDGSILEKPEGKFFRDLLSV